MSLLVEDMKIKNLQKEMKPKTPKMKEVD